KRIRLFIEFLAEQLKDGFKNAL
ncbi:MAG: hypothetical protein ACN6OA_06520, partial [Acinetobacter baumannii]